MTKKLKIESTVSINKDSPKIQHPTTEHPQHRGKRQLLRRYLFGPGQTSAKTQQQLQTSWSNTVRTNQRLRRLQLRA